MNAVTSSQPRKQRKWFHTKPLHKMQEDFGMHLVASLRKSLGKRSLNARKGDTVKVVRGNENYVGKQGKITEIRRKKKQVLIEGITRKKVDGKEIPVPFRPSNLMLVSIDETDKKRIKKPKTKKDDKKGDVKNGK